MWELVIAFDDGGIEPGHFRVRILGVDLMFKTVDKVLAA